MSAKFLQIVSGAIKEAVAAILGDIAVDGNLSSAAQDAIAKKHAQSHALDSTSDHSPGSLSANYHVAVKSDGTELVNASNTDSQIAAAVTASHAALTLDTTLAANLLALAAQVLSLNTQSANKVFGGPSSGSAAAPGFRSLTVADLPSGSLIQRQYIQRGDEFTVNTALPNDDTIPQIAEGGQVLTLSFTPLSATSTLEIEVWVVATTTTSSIAIMALFSSGNDALAAVEDTTAGASEPLVVTLKHTMTSGTTSAIPFQARLGNGTPSTFTINGVAAARRMGGVMTTGIIVKEFKT